MASANPSRSFTDIRRDDWVDRLVPAGLRPYCRLARLDRPIGTWLLLLSRLVVHRAGRGTRRGGRASGC